MSTEAVGGRLLREVAAESATLKEVRLHRNPFCSLRSSLSSKLANLGMQPVFHLCERPISIHARRQKASLPPQAKIANLIDKASSSRKLTLLSLNTAPPRPSQTRKSQSTQDRHPRTRYPLATAWRASRDLWPRPATPLPHCQFLCFKVREMRGSG